MRLDKPIGIYLLFWPTLWASWIANQDHPNLANAVIFILGMLIMRSAGCVINDFANHHVDEHVERIQHRPDSPRPRLSKKYCHT